jgi:hypothetical protein
MDDMSLYSGWNPEIGWKPQDDLSLQLLNSIPKKVFSILDNLGEQVIGPGSAGQLRWNFDLSTGTIIYGNEDDKTFFQIWWTGDPVHPTDIRGSDQRFRFLAHDLEFFIQIERCVYEEMEKLQEELSDLPVINSKETWEAYVKRREAEGYEGDN